MEAVAVNDYPRTWSEFLDWFGSEEACPAYLERLRWPQGFVCPSCGVATSPYRVQPHPPDVPAAAATRAR